LEEPLVDDELPLEDEPLDEDDDEDEEPDPPRTFFSGLVSGLLVLVDGLSVDADELPSRPVSQARSSVGRVRFSRM
jgi:hypothetical protein